MAWRVQHIAVPMIAALFSLLVGSLLIRLAGASPLEAYNALIVAGFGCRGAGGFCALLTTLQYATPLILSGLSAIGKAGGAGANHLRAGEGHGRRQHIRRHHLLDNADRVVPAFEIK